MDLAGDFETHLTVRPPAGPDDALATWAATHDLKYSRIVLDRGTTPDQPMLTARGHGSLPTLQAAARTWADRLRSAGFEVTRVKVEAAPWNDGVPRTDDDAATEPPDRYWEHHVKVVLPAGEGSEDDGPATAVAELRELAAPHGAHVSRNARRLVDGDRQERFVTQRCYRVGRPMAKAALDALLAALAAADVEVIEVEEEYVAWDDNLALDAGWLDSKGQ
jgi:hypothetical protein